MVECYLCGACGFDLLQERNNYKIIQCQKCGLVCLDLVLNKVAVRKLYSEPYFRNADGKWVTRGYPNYFAMERALIKKFSKRVKKILKIVDKGRLLDVGCGPGFFLNVAAKQFEVVGVDISEFACLYAQKHFGLHVMNCLLEECGFGEAIFDVVTVWDTIEHLTSPKETLLEINRILKNGGLLVIETGDVESIFARLMGRRWHLYNVPEHIYYFSQRTITDILEKTGFSVQAIKYEWSYFNIPYLLDRLVRTIHPSGGYKTQSSFLASMSLPVNLFDVMTVYALKK